MRASLVVTVVLGLAAPAVAETIETTHFADMASVESFVAGGFDAFARGDTKVLRVTRADPPAQSEVPFTLWNNGIPHAFRVVYNPGGVAGLSIDDLYAVEQDVTIDPGTNGLLVTAFTSGAGRSVLLDNLQITLPGFAMYPVGDTAQSPNPDYMVIRTDLSLVNGFILSGTVTFAWDGDVPAPAAQWFEVTPVVVPEPATAGLLTLGLLALCRRR